MHGHVVLIDRTPSATLLSSLRAAGFDVSCVTGEQPIAELIAQRHADAVIIAADHPAREQVVEQLTHGRSDAPIVWLERGATPSLVADVIHDPPQPDQLRLLSWMTTAERGRRAGLDSKKEASDAGHLSELGRVVTQVAHEIRNPLTALSAKLQWLKRKAEHDATIGQMSASLLDEVDRLARMLNDVLEFGRTRTYSRRTSADVAPTLEQVVALYKETAEAAQVQLVLETCPDSRVPYPSEELHQIFQNLLSNAIDATPPDETIRILVKKESGRLAVEFRNPGHLQEETLSHMFDLFFTTKPNGTGLGLAIVRRIVESAEGDIDVINDGKDVVFRLRLPLSS